MWIKPLTFQGKHVLLAPLSIEHHDGLIEAAGDGELWNLWYTFVPTPHKMREIIEFRLKGLLLGNMVPYTVIDANTNKILGATNYLNIEAENRRLEIGGTWYKKGAQRTAINTECKMLLLNYAFETLNCIAVEFRTHVENAQSRKAIERIGAKLDGVLRNHMIMPNGTLRDTCVYSIIASEWQTTKTNLLQKMT